MPFPASHPALERALAARGYEQPTAVQSAVLESATPGADLLVSAQTGSGKTVAFGLALANTLLGDDEVLPPPQAPLALVIAPTRELALQVARELDWLYGEARARVTVCVGGMDARREARALDAGCHIVVGTPGRLRDHLERGYLDLSALKAAVLDEADEMLDLGFREDLEFILDTTPPERRTLLFSATIDHAIAGLARRYQRDAERIDTTSRTVPHGDIEYRAVTIAPNEIERAVVNVLRYFEAPGALVFCATRETVRHMHASLRERGFSVVSLSGELSQRERADALQALRDGRARVCIATDVAARGLDLPDLGLVIHAELPVNKAALLHRSGRTGRAGRKGVSVLLVPYTRRRRAEQMLGAAHIDAIWSGPPNADEIRAQDETRLLDDPTLTEAAAEDDAVLAAKLVERLTPEQIAAALARRLRADLPAPEELYDDPRAREPQGRGRERPDRDRSERAPRHADGAQGESAWFRLSVGRRKNADPKWLIPMICRLGHVTKRDIGAIRIFDTETKFEIALDVAERFTQAVAATRDEEVRIEPTVAPGGQGAPRRPRPSGPSGPYAPALDTMDAPAPKARPAKPFKPKKPKRPANGARA